MQLGSILARDAISLLVEAQSKKQILRAVAKQAAESFGLNERETFEQLSAREKLGSTGFGDGIALPHCRMEAVDSCHAVLLTLANPVDFDADDDAPVDLVLGLIAPATADADSLKCLAKTSRLLKDPKIAEQLRTCTSPDLAYSLLTGDGYDGLAKDVGDKDQFARAA